MSPLSRFGVSRIRGYAILIMAGLVILAVAAAASFFLSGYEIAQSNHRWCDTLSLLTSRPVQPPADPAKDPSREGQYRMYEDFVTLKSEFGCR